MNTPGGQLVPDEFADQLSGLIAEYGVRAPRRRWRLLHRIVWRTGLWRLLGWKPVKFPTFSGSFTVKYDK